VTGGGGGGGGGGGVRGEEEQDEEMEEERQHVLGVREGVIPDDNEDKNTRIKTQHTSE
jgi:hypothetical protein